MVVAIALAGVMPWLIWKSLQFTLFNTSYRSVRFGFQGSAGGAYQAFLLWPILAVASAGLLGPKAHHQFKKFQHSEARFGASRFNFRDCVGGFYHAYLMGIGVLVVAGLVFLLLVFGGALLGAAAAKGKAGFFLMLVTGALFFYAAMIVVVPVVLARLQNHIWNHTALAAHRFASTLPVGRVVFVTLTNLVAIVFTLGLFIPFAAVRMARLKIEALSLIPAASIEHFLADNQNQAGSLGEGMADLLDLDISV